MASADRSTLFINSTVLDGSEHMEPQPDMAVTVERGVITWMGPSAVAQALRVPRLSTWQVRISCQASSICMCICAARASRFRLAMRER